MTNSALCDLNSKSDKLKLHSRCHNPKCNFQKQITFTPKQLQLEGNGLKITLRKNSNVDRKFEIQFLNQSLKL